MRKPETGTKWLVLAWAVVCGFSDVGIARAADTPAPSPSDRAWYEKAADTAATAANQVNTALNLTRDHRAKGTGFALIDYSPFDLLIPSKYGATLGLVQNADATWEVEYLRGTIGVPFIVDDLGEFTDQRLSVIRRSYWGGNSFNISYGISYFKLGMHLGDDILNRISGGAYPPSVDLVQTEGLGFNIAFGNRWTFDNKITFGIDWISWSQPVYRTKEDSAYLQYATDPGDRAAIDDAVKIMSYFPRVAVFKLQLGILF